MSTSEATIVMVPRERYSGILRAIDSLYEETTDVPFDFVYADGALPDEIRTEVERKAGEKGFKFIHKDYPLTPNEARNIGLAEATAPYVVFTDNDVMYTPGWLRLLLDAAKDFDAELVGPVILDGDLDPGAIHAAAGVSGFDIVNGKKRYHYKPNCRHENLPDVRDSLVRGPVSMLEFHVILCRRDLFDKIGPFDEGIESYADHDDLIVSTFEAGGKAIFEPESVVRYDDPGYDMSILERRDFPMFFLRWGNDWNDRSVVHLAKKWDLDPEDTWPIQAGNWIRIRRRRAYSVVGPYGKFVGFVYYKISKSLGEMLEGFITRHYTRRLVALRESHANH